METFAEQQEETPGSLQVPARQQHTMQPQTHFLFHNLTNKKTSELRSSWSSSGFVFEFATVPSVSYCLCAQLSYNKQPLHTTTRLLE